VSALGIPLVADLPRAGQHLVGPAGDSLAMVDQHGRVHGVQRLRVIDASISPIGPHGNLHFPVVAAAEKIADAIRTGS